MKEFLKELRVSARGEYLPVMREETTELLAKITESIRPKEVLEIGTCLGISGITVLLSGAERLTTIDIDGNVIEKAKQNFLRCGVRERAEFIEGDCFETLKYMGNNRYDLAVIDGPKSKYCELFDIIFPMMNKGGIIFCDDVDFYGKVKEANPERKHRTIVRGMQAFYEKIKNDDRISAEFFEIEDGVAVIKVK